MNDDRASKAADFVLRVDGLRLDDAARDRIAAALQSSLMAELGRLDLGAARTPTMAYIPRKEWYGIWLRTLAQLRDFRAEEFEKPLNVTQGVR